MKARYGVAVAAVVLLLTMVVEVGLSTRQQSPSWDEGDHIFAGYMNWINGEYTLNPEHPPLVKLVATLPLVPLDLRYRSTTALKLKASTSEIFEKMKTDPALKAKIEADPTLFVRPGGLLVMAGSDIIGAFGVGGVPGPGGGGVKDEACAKAGLDKIKARIK